MFELSFTPYVLPLVLALVVSLFLAQQVWRRRPGTGVIPFTILMTATSWWIACYIVEILLVDKQAKVFAIIGEYIGITIVPAAWLATASAYTGRDKWLTRRTVRLLAIEPIAVLVLIITNDWHHLLWTAISVTSTDPFTVISTSKGALFWVHAVYSYILILLATLTLIRAMVRYPTLYREQVGLLIVGIIAPWIANFTYLVLDYKLFGALDPTPVAFAATGTFFGYSLLRFRLLDVVPVARDTVIESMSDAMLVLDKQGRIIDANPVAVRLSRQPNVSALLGKLVTQVLPEQRNLIRTFAEVEEARAEISLQGPGGAGRDFELRLSPIRNRQGELTGRVIVLRDTTEMKRTAAQLQAQNDLLVTTNRDLEIAQHRAEEAARLKSEFVATMSHELRTPLNAIIGYTDIILGGMAGEINDDLRSLQDRVMLNANNLLSLINDILDLSKMEAGRIELQNAPFSVKDLIDTVVTQTAGLAEEKKLVFQQQIAEDFPASLIGDADRLRQILLNLVSNAIKFTSQGSVTIRVSRLDDARWSLAVTDTGIGIPLHAQDYIFDEFRQVDGSTERQYGGTGLGLAIARKLVILMGGTIQVRSAPGAGSTFTVNLPLLPATVSLASVNGKAGTAA